MTDYLARGAVNIGDVRLLAKELEPLSVQCIVCSPPYYGLRSYLDNGHASKGQELGSEKTPAEFVANLVAVFAALRPALKDSGTLWCNLGDSFGPDKCLYGMPWRVAFALIDDGWILRSDVIWSKGNPMPESVNDRPTRSHEYLFLFSKRPAYYFDSAAIAEPASGARPGVARVVQRANLSNEGVILGDHLGLEYADTKRPVAPARVTDTRRLFEDGIRLASAILDRAQLQDQLGLPPLDSQVGQQGANGQDRIAVGRTPERYRAAELATRFLAADMAPKHFLEEMERLEITLPDGDILGVAGGVALVADTPGVYRNGNTAVGIDDPGQVSERQVALFHGHLLDEKYTTESTTSSGATRNKRSVWTVNSAQFPGSHFATFPPDLIRPCVLAGTSEAGECANCGKAWRRVVERDTNWQERKANGAWAGNVGVSATYQNGVHGNGMSHDLGGGPVRQLGWSPQCSCPPGTPTRRQVVLDPFAGSCTTWQVCVEEGRDFVGIDLDERASAWGAARVRKLPVGRLAGV